MNQLDDGLYLGLPDADYHAQQRLSASGIKNLLISPMNYWCDSWLNPRRRTEEDPDWAVFGKAQHMRICEGKAEFDKHYAPYLDPGDHPDALIKAEQLKDACRALNLPVSGTKEVLSARLREWGEQRIWDDLVAAHEHANQGKTFLSKQWLWDIEIAAACIEKDPILSKCFQGGVPEVSILWTEEFERPDGSGEILKVPMKSRMDYLKPKAIVDLKTYANQSGRSIKRAITYEIASRRYAVQAAVYYRAAAVAKAFASQNKIVGTASPAWIAAFTAAEEIQFVFVFLQKGTAAVSTGWIMPPYLGLISVAEVEVQQAQIMFHDCLKTFGADPWVVSRPLEMLGDGDVPVWSE